MKPIKHNTTQGKTNTEQQQTIKTTIAQQYQFYKQPHKTITYQYNTITNTRKLYKTHRNIKQNSEAQIKNKVKNNTNIYIHTFYQQKP